MLKKSNKKKQEWIRLSTWPTSNKPGARSTQLYFFSYNILKKNMTDKLFIINHQIYTPQQELNP